MKKFSLGITGLFAGIVFAVCMLGGCSVGTYYKYSDADAYTAGSGSVSVEGVTSISVDWICGDVTFLPTDTTLDEIVFEEETSATNEDYLLHSSLSGGELKIKFQKSGTWYKNNFSKKLTVKVPHNLLLRLLDVEVVSGEVNVWTISAIDADIESVSGDINLHQFKADKLSAESVSGDISVNMNSACNATFDTVSGNVSIDTGTAGFRVSYDTVSGRVNNLCGAAKNGAVYSYGDERLIAQVDTVSGNLKLDSKPALPDA